MGIPDQTYRAKRAANQHPLLEYFTTELGWGSDYQSQIVFRFLCEAAEFAKGGIVLDAGAGAQRYKPFFDDSIYIAQEHAASGAERKGLTSYDILADVRRIPLKDGSVDLVLSTSSLEHMEFPEQFFSEAHRVLKPGGALFIHVPFVYNEHEIPYDFQRPTRYGLQSSYRNAGFESADVLPASSSLYTGQFFFLHALKEDADAAGLAIWTRVARKVMLWTAPMFCKIAMRCFDRGPREQTSFPIGWVAKGLKPGVRVAGPNPSSKLDFMNAHADCDSTMVLVNGQVLPAS